jgi:hypothetical protein
MFFLTAPFRERWATLRDLSRIQRFSKIQVLS